MNGLYYLAEANLYLGVFYLAYCLFLNRNTHYQLSRAYLIFSCIIAFILPLVQVSALKQVRSVEPANASMPVSFAEPANTFSAVRPVVHPAVKAIEQYYSPAPITHIAPIVTHQHFTWQNGLLYAYLIGAT